MDGTPHHVRPFLPGAGLLLALAALWVVCSSAAADTVITETGTDFLYALDSAGSPYILGHDFAVRPGGTLFIGAGAQLQVENGSRIIGQGGDIVLEGTSTASAVVRGRPGAAAPSFAGIDLGSGTNMTVRWGLIENGSHLITVGAGSSVIVRNSQLRECGTWCIKSSPSTDYEVVDVSFENGAWGIFDNGTTDGEATNTSFTGFTSGAIWLRSPSSAAQFRQTTVTDSALGVQVEGAVGATFTGLNVTTDAGPALSGSSPIDLHVVQANLVSLSGVAVNISYSSRLMLSLAAVNGDAGALRLSFASAAWLRNSTFSSSNGACLDMPGATGGVLNGNVLSNCSESLRVARGESPPDVVADATNRVGTRPFLWVKDATALVINATANPGLVVLINVNGANITDLSLQGSGLYLFGCNNVYIERLRVTSAHSAVTAVGVQGLTVKQLVAENVQFGVEAWGQNGVLDVTRDIDVDHSHVVAAAQAAYSFERAANVTLWQIMADGGGAGIELIDVEGAFIDRVVMRGAATGIYLANATGVTVVGCVLELNLAMGVLASANSTGVASRNAFLNNIVQASAPGAPGFLFNETGGGNFWSDFNGPDPGGDGWADIPYDFPDGTGHDYRARVIRYDFGPTPVVNASGLAEIGSPFTFGGAYAFDDFAVANIYWSVVFPDDAAQGEGQQFVWTPNRTGTHVVTMSVVGSLGATEDYVFELRVIDTTSPSFTAAVSGRPEAGANATVVVTGTDNDALFPAGATVIWRLEPPAALARAGTAAGLTFEVPVDTIGNHTLRLTLVDASGNRAQLNITFVVQDTEPPELVVTFDGNPGLGAPFALDASESFDPSGINDSSANWSWTEDFAVRSVPGWPAAQITFEHLGTFNVTVRVCDLLGNCAAQVFALTVQDRTGPVLVRVHVVVPKGDTLDLTPGSSQVVNAVSGDDVVFEIFAHDPGGALTFEWDFGDGTTGNGSSVVHRFDRSGDFSVVIRMIDPSGNVNVTAVRMHVDPAPFLGGFIPGPPAVPALALAALIAALAGGALGRKRQERGR